MRKASAPLAAMEARSVDEIPQGPKWQYEPKWDGFRCILAPTRCSNKVAICCAMNSSLWQPAKIPVIGESPSCPCRRLHQLRADISEAHRQAGSTSEQYSKGLPVLQPAKFDLVQICRKPICRQLQGRHENRERTAAARERLADTTGKRSQSLLLCDAARVARTKSRCSSRAADARALLAFRLRRPTIKRPATP